MRHSSLFSGPNLRTLDGIDTSGVPSSLYVGEAARYRLRDFGLNLAAQGNRRVPSALSSGGGNFATRSSSERVGCLLFVSSSGSHHYEMATE